MDLTHPDNDGIAPGQLLAYRQARYVVASCEVECVLQIHVASAGLAAFMRERSISTAAFLTAANPHSTPCSASDNAHAQHALQADLDALGCLTLVGRGEDPSGCWPPEPSVLALGIGPGEAAQLAIRYRQNAFVWIATPDAFCTLRLMRPLAVPCADDLAAWCALLPADEADAARQRSPMELAWLMSVSDIERRHWLLPQGWDLNRPWPLARPDGTVMHAGTELDRQFRLAAAGLGPMQADATGSR